MWHELAQWLIGCFLSLQILWVVPTRTFVRVCAEVEPVVRTLPTLTLLSRSCRRDWGGWCCRSWCRLWFRPWPPSLTVPALFLPLIFTSGFEITPMTWNSWLSEGMLIPRLAWSISFKQFLVESPNRKINIDWIFSVVWHLILSLFDIRGHVDWV